MIVRRKGSAAKRQSAPDDAIINEIVEALRREREREQKDYRPVEPNSNPADRFEDYPPIAPTDWAEGLDD